MLIPDVNQSVAVDRRGNVYVAATEYDPTTSYNIALAKYSSSGVRRWVRRYTGPGVDLWTILRSTPRATHMSPAAAPQRRPAQTR